MVERVAPVPGGPVLLLLRPVSPRPNLSGTDWIPLGTPVIDETRQLCGLVTFNPPYSLSMIPASNWYRPLLLQYGALKVLGSPAQPAREFGIAAYEPPPQPRPEQGIETMKVEDSSGQSTLFGQPNTPVSPTTAFRAELCSKLEQRIADTSIQWAYHPRSGLGRLITECLIDVMKRSSTELERALHSQQIRFQEAVEVQGSQRSRRTDLVVERVRPPRLLAAVEVKVCMTEHSKARSRMIDELRSSLDILSEAEPRARIFFVVVVNFSDKFTSPTRLPGPNLHSPNAGLKLFNALYESLGGLEKLAGLLLVPIDFDNATRCRPVPDPGGDYLEAEAQFVRKLTRAALERSADAAGSGV